MEIEQKSRNVLIVKFNCVKAGWEKWFMLSSDRHHDSTLCDQAFEKRQLEQAVQKDAHIIDCGDLFDAMQGKGDKRSSYAELRPELVGRQDYFGALTNYNYAFYKPYQERFLLLGKGNHETSVTDKCGLDLTSNLVDRINQNRTDGNRTYAGGYGGWIRFQFTMHRTNRASCNLKYFHGSGGDSPVTKGTIATNRQAVFLPDADIVVNGHDHNAYYVPIARERLSDMGVIKKDLIHFIRTPGYKDSFGDGSGGWDVTSGKPPKPRGCIWLHFVYNADNIDIEIIPSVK